ncbi:MAG: non-lysosomal glucosylceramidase [Acidobacteriaceae bacterium]|nr:non-lysosomal glucosylceramidase [Acidobacteriaceae bacterium]
MSRHEPLPRRAFLKQAAGAIGAATQVGGWPTLGEAIDNESPAHISSAAKDGGFPRVFAGRKLKMIAFPLGGVAAGSVALGGRGQLRDWEIFNRPNKGYSPAYAFPSIWAQAGNAKPVARVLEARILPPYEGQDGLGSNNAPGLSRLEAAIFTGAYPLAHIAFEDRTLPVTVELEAFSPFIPHEPDDSGLPVAILRYRVTNPKSMSAKVSIAWSLENPVKTGPPGDPDPRQNTYQSNARIAGLTMSNPALPESDPMRGTIALAALAQPGVQVQHWRGWPQGRWWNSPMLFWDAFSASGELGAEPEVRNAVGAVLQGATIAPHQSQTFTFLLAWHFPNRTPEWCGWDAPRGKGGTRIGNYYATRFDDAWAAADYTAQYLESLERRTRLFADAFRESTLPAAVKEAASANLSTLASTTCFRTADGEFHGFEGVDDTHGCCFGNCTHVWNYETATAFLFPSFARSLRKASFGYSMDDAGAMRFRQMLPDGYDRFGWAAADGQMGQILHAYLDWKLTGDDGWLRAMWPRLKKAIEFAWVPGGWDANRDGVMEGVQHNTYDVEFYGPNPLCGIYYLGALRASEEMARRLGDTSSTAEYHRLFTQGSRWIDANLFNGKYYVQQVRGFRNDQIAPHLRGDMGANETEHPEYQMGDGCLVDQLMGQYLASVAGLGDLVSSEHMQSTLRAIYNSNYKRTLLEHDNVERTFALNDEAAVLVCSYAEGKRPRIPFPYYAEVFTGLEHATAAMMMYADMVDEGTEYIANTRARYDGEKRNPWDEAECGHHYARAMSSWSSVVALSGFDYDGAQEAVTAVPRVSHRAFRSFWASGTGWGEFTYAPGTTGGTFFTLRVLAGKLRCRSVRITAVGSRTRMRVGEKEYSHSAAASDKVTLFTAEETIVIGEGDELRIEARA